jgi:hypothetical protein
MVTQKELKIAKIFYKWGKRRALFEIEKIAVSLRRNKRFIDDFDMDTEDLEILNKLGEKHGLSNTTTNIPNARMEQV